MRTDADLWEWLEVRGWVWSGRRAKSAPRKTMRRRFARLNAADQAAIVPLIQRLRNNIATKARARAAVRPEAPDFGDPTADDHGNDLIALGQAEGNLATTCGLLRDERARHARSEITVKGLDGLQSDCVNRMRDSLRIATDFQTGLRDWKLLHHPAGTPPDTPPSTRTAGAAASDDPHTERAIPPPPTDAWLGAFQLAPGGQATPVVYVRQNRHGQIIDRVCIKDTTWPTDPVVDDTSSSLWDPDIDPLDNPRDRQPAEIGALNRLNALPNSQSIIQLRNWNRLYNTDADNEASKYRVFLEWCGYGDLYNFSRKYTPYGDVRGRPRPRTVEREDWIPEPFLWACFEQLVNAGVLMQRGNYNPVQAPQYWSEIIHRDLKPDNVFLTQNTTDIYKGYPMVKLGDFGVSTILSTSLARRLPDPLYLHFGTPFCFAPEQLKLKDNGDHDISSKTNVWGIGIILWGLMHSRRIGDSSGIYSENPDADDDFLPLDPQTAAFSADHQTHYSEELRTLVLRCLTLNPDNRPDFDTLLQTIGVETSPSGYVVDRSRGLRNADARDPRFGSDSFALKLSEERYAMYSYLSRSMARPPEPNRGAATDVMETDVELFGGVEPGGGVNLE
ncbi:hypothetical protein CERZMDRAFT_98258 [Cercospora zeae-maydis SCOH1-5]|uniref:non-specific serine/threonine protein kinase n=1 Tax=Cercospora zeae-maydis SCOH1-5 TaxID=717836 RepID=A0A6A6FEM4_9PEZI|nr:hypothetical protein CERZMDRAFT_98258 [Cercospora zeae-maydis SCOH1-5]